MHLLRVVSRRHVFLAAIAVSLFTLWVFWPCVHHEFLHWDDQENFIRNDRFRGLGPSNLLWMFTTTHMGPYQPLSWVTLGLDYLIWGMNPHGYHLTNVLIHSVNAGLMVWVTILVLTRWLPVPQSSAESGETWRPLREGAVLIAGGTAGLLWAIHPLRVESVAWVTERRDVMSGLFSLPCVGSYLIAETHRGSGRHQDRWFLLSQVCCLLALISKATAVCLPVILLVLDVFPLRRLTGPIRTWLRRPQRTVLTEKASYVVFALFAIGMGFLGQYRGGAVQSLSQVGVLDRLALAAHAFVFYLAKTVFPFDLTPMYPRPVPLDLLSARFVISVVAVAATTGVLVVVRKRYPAGLVFWICYVAAVLPTSGLLTIGQELVADRYSYLPSILVCLLIAGAAHAAWRHVGSAGRGIALGSATVVAVALLAGATRAYIPAWHDSISLWKHAVGIHPHSARALTNLGGSYALAERYTEAIDALDLAIAEDPNMHKAHYNRGRVLLDLGRPKEAERAFAEAIRLLPNYLWAHEWRGVSLLKLDRVGEAIDEFQRALEIDPSSVSVQLRLGEAYCRKRDYDGAIGVYERLLSKGICQPEVYAGLTEAHLLQGRVDLAERVMSSAPSSMTHHANFLYALAKLRSGQNRIAEAIDLLRESLMARPDLRIDARRDSLLKNVQKDPRFDRLMAEIESELVRKSVLRRVERARS